MSKLRRAINNRGVLLLEVLITVAVLGTGLVVILQALGTSLRTTQTAQKLTQASLLAEEKLSELKQKALLEKGIAVGQASGDFGEENSEFSWKSEITATGTPALNQAAVTVSWQKQQRERGVSLVTYLRAKKSEE